MLAVTLFMRAVYPPILCPCALDLRFCEYTQCQEANEETCECTPALRILQGGLGPGSVSL